MKGRYFPKTTLENIQNPKPYHSTIWKNLYKCIKYLKESIVWIIGNQQKINFWKDKWLGNFTIEEYNDHIPPDFLDAKRVFG